MAPETVTGGEQVLEEYFIHIGYFQIGKDGMKKIDLEPCYYLLLEMQLIICIGCQDVGCQDLSYGPHSMTGLVPLGTWQLT